MSYGSQSKNPHEHTEQDEHEDQHVYCRDCGGYLGLRDNLGPEHWFNGWAWCPEIAAMLRASSTPDHMDEVRR